MVAQQDFPIVQLKNVYNGVRNPLFYPERNNETLYVNSQKFWFRPFKVFGSTIYLTEGEQRKSNLLLGHLILTSFASLPFIFVFVTILYYAIKRTI